MFDPAIVELILAGFLGLTVLGITEMIKRFLKVGGIWGYVISFFVSVAFTLYFLLNTHTFTWAFFIGYSIFVFLAANGIYKAKVKQA